MASETVLIASPKQFWGLINPIREKQFVTCAALAGRIGVSRSTIALMRQGHHVPTWETMNAIADVLGVALIMWRPSGRSPAFGSPLSVHTSTSLLLDKVANIPVRVVYDETVPNMSWAIGLCGRLVTDVHPVTGHFRDDISVEIQRLSQPEFIAKGQSSWAG